MSNNQPKPFYINRRNFLKGSTAALALSSFGAYGLDIMYSPRKIRVGLIGCGWYGKSDLFKLIQVANVEVVSLCDVDRNYLEEAAKLVSERQKSGKKPRLYKDYRTMLAEKDLDIVLIGSPDHWHALQAIEAMEAGAHLYLQKPISLDVLEGEAILATARKLGKKVQIGTQRRSTPHLVEGKKNIIEAGLLGKISHVDMCCYYHMRWNANPPFQEIPDYFDYDLWSGPASMRPFVGVPHRTWRAFMEYGNGIVGDMCVHMLDTVRWMLGLGWPKKVSSTGGIYVQKDSIANISDTQTAVFEFDELNCIWQHRSWGTPPDPEYPWAFFIYGEKGTLKGSVYKYEFIPNDGGKTIKMDALYEREQFPEDLKEKDIELHTAPATRAHMLDLLAAIENDTLPVADVEEGHISTASCIMANLSMDLKRPLIYNPQQRIIVDDPEATALLKREYRGSWQHPSEYML
ncbi:Gfo/Idh/MocA family oxidoreductase [Muricauda sp. CAU 1633]|uniref:Gfo/Idh/MocA family oxidoreductase n=1 Tax=Allomuricauda sp. CAU 1633 TaxID=2816036 RepID=UPI001A8CC1CE|nr:Gfo/Idh/MocA family oxidoreductase [Muricauda sp. CAU 1633]MBO0321045.1 Gfo/Idh/MocA family oxidoreductase [Muricauda sp. CAU 1633]